MSRTASQQSIGTVGGNDMGARMARLQDLIERDARGSAHGLPTVFHEVAGVGAMHAPGEDHVVLVTLVTATGQSHVFALGREQAKHFRSELVSLRLGVSAIAARARAEREPVTKPSGRIL